MKTCKHYQEQISKAATKCPKCQSFQYWYRNPQIIMLLPMLLFISFLYTMMSTRMERLDFEDFKDQITLTRLSKDTIQVQNKKMINLLVEIANTSEHQWKNAIYEVKYLSSTGDLLTVEKDSDYQFVLSAHDKTISSIKVPVYEQYENVTFELKLSRLSHYRY